MILSHRQATTVPHSRAIIVLTERRKILTWIMLPSSDRYQTRYGLHPVQLYYHHKIKVLISSRIIGRNSLQILLLSHRQRTPKIIPLEVLVANSHAAIMVFAILALTSHPTVRRLIKLTASLGPLPNRATSHLLFTDTRPFPSLLSVTRTQDRSIKRLPRDTTLHHHQLRRRKTTTTTTQHREHALMYCLMCEQHQKHPTMIRSTVPNQIKSLAKLGGVFHHSKLACLQQV
jgi:hypothetical protein